MSGGPAERGSDELRAAIHLAALRRFARDGYRGATLRDIATDAGLGSAAHLYYYAPRKADLLAEVVVTYASLPQDLLDEQPGDDPRDVVERFMRRYLAAFADERRLLAFQLLSQEAAQLAASGTDGLTANLVGTILGLQQWFDDQMAQGRLRTSSPVAAARALLGFCNLHVQLRGSGVVARGAAADAEAAQEALDVLWRGLSPDG